MADFDAPSTQRQYDGRGGFRDVKSRVRDMSDPSGGMNGQPFADPDLMLRNAGMSYGERLMRRPVDVTQMPLGGGSPVGDQAPGISPEGKLAAAALLMHQNQQSEAQRAVAALMRQREMMHAGGGGY